MLLVIGLFLLLLAVLALVLTAWSIWFQSYLYTEVSEGMPWRGPAAAGAIMLPMLLWMLMARSSPDTYRPLWEIQSTETLRHFDKLWAPDSAGKMQEYRFVGGGTRRYHQRGDMNAPALRSDPPVVEVEEEGVRVAFFPEKDAAGNLLRRKSRVWFTEVAEPLRFVDARGRIMVEGSLGQLTRFKGGSLMANLMLNFLLLAACFAGFWPLLRFQWPHALGQAVILWLVLLLTVVPPLMKSVEAGVAPAAKG